MHPASVSSSRLKRNLASHRSRRRSTGSWWPWPRLAVKDNRPTNQTDINQPGRPQPILIPRWATVTSSQWLASVSWSEPCAQYQGSVHNHNHEQWTSINHVAMLCPFFQVVIPFSNCCVFNSSNRGPIVPCFVTSSLTKVTALIIKPTQAVLWSRFESCQPLQKNCQRQWHW